MPIIKNSIVFYTISLAEEILVDTVQTKCPDLAALAQQQASTFDTIDALKLLTLQIMTTPDAETVRKLLETGPQR